MWGDTYAVVPGDLARFHTGKGLSPDPSLCWWNTPEEQVGGWHKGFSHLPGSDEAWGCLPPPFAEESYGTE